MRYFLIIVSFLVIIQLDSLNAQTGQGKLLIGVISAYSLYEAGSGTNLMTLGYTTSKTKSDMSTGQSKPDKLLSLYLAPKVGYFIFNNLTLGLDISISLLEVIYGQDNSKITETLFGAGPFIRYYIPAGKVLPFIEANGLFASSQIKSPPSGQGLSTLNGSLVSFGGEIGIAMPLGNKVMFDLSAGYNSMTYRLKELKTYNYRTVEGTIGLKFGFVVLLGSD